MEVPQAVSVIWGVPVIASSVDLLPGLFLGGLFTVVGLVAGGNSNDGPSRPLARESVLEKVRAGLLALDEDGVVLDANARARELLGIDDSELVGTGVDRLDPELATALDQSREDAQSTEPVTSGATPRWSVAPIEGKGEPAWVVTLQSSPSTETAGGVSTNSIVESIDDPIFAIDDAGRFRFANEAFTDIFGGEPEMIVGMHLSVVIDQAVAEQLVERAVSVSADALPETLTFDVTATDGSEQVLEAVLTEYDGGVCCQLRDVTPTEQRRRATDRYRTIVDAMTDPAGTVDETGQFTVANESLARTSGYPQSMLVEQRLSTLVSASDLREIESFVDQLRAAGKRRGTIDITLLTRDGKELPVELECALLGEEASEDGFACIFRDLSTKRKRQSDLKQYETIVEGLADPVWTISTDGAVTFVNRAFESKTNHRREQLVGTGTDIVDLVTTGDVDRLRTIVGQLVHGDRDGQATVELNLLTSDGLEIPVEMNLTSLADRADIDPKYHGVAAVARDITDRRRRQEVLTVTNRVLRHNLRTHANMISGYADMLGEIAEGPDAEGHIDRIQASTDWLSKLGETLRDLQRAVEQNRTPSEPLTIESIAKLVDSYDTEYPDAAIEMTIDTQELIDAGPAFSRAIEEVLENAILHNDADDRAVSVRIISDEDEDDWVLLEIADNGPGIPQTERAVVLGETEVTQLEHGSGIGLWATRWLIQTIGGEIEITDNDPRGTIVTLRLPALEQSTESDDDEDD